jgi:hypothetical protein
MFVSVVSFANFRIVATWRAMYCRRATVFPRSVAYPAYIRCSAAIVPTGMCKSELKGSALFGWLQLRR